VGVGESLSQRNSTRFGGGNDDGEEIILADVLAAPTINRMSDLGLAYLWEEKYPRVSHWYIRLQACSAFRRNRLRPYKSVRTR
jgi:glutathione S-transferase